MAQTTSPHANVALNAIFCRMEILMPRNNVKGMAVVIKSWMTLTRAWEKSAGVESMQEYSCTATQLGTNRFQNADKGTQLKQRVPRQMAIWHISNAINAQTV